MRREVAKVLKAPSKDSGPFRAELTERRRLINSSGPTTPETKPLVERLRNDTEMHLTKVVVKCLSIFAEEIVNSKSPVAFASVQIFNKGSKHSREHYMS